jgi:hypothetical protein
LGDVVLKYGRFHPGEVAGACWSLPNFLAGDVEPSCREGRRFGIASFLGGVQPATFVLGQLIDVESEEFFSVPGGVHDLEVSEVVTGGGLDDIMVAAGHTYSDNMHNFVTVRASAADSLEGWRDFFGVGGHVHDLDVDDLSGDGNPNLLATASARDLVLGEVGDQGQLTDVCRLNVLGTCLSSGTGDFNLDGRRDIVTLVAFDRIMGVPDDTRIYFITR